MENIRKAIERFSGSKNGKRTAFALFAVIALFFLVQIGHDIAKNRPIDFTTYGISSKALMDGHMPYDTGSPFRYIYPVFFTFIFMPFAVLPYWLQGLLWFALGLLALYYSVFTVIRIAMTGLNMKDETQAYVPLAFLSVILLPCLQHNFVNGESNAFILLFCVLFFKYYLKDKMIPSAFFLALGVSIKLVPLIFLLFLLYRRRFGYFFLTIAFTAAMLLLPAVIAGNRIFDYYRYYWDNFLVMETSISAVLDKKTMFFTTSKMISYIMPEGLSNTALVIAGLLINGVFLLFAEIVFSLKKLSKSKEVWIFNVYLLVMLMTMPKSQYHHLIYMIPPVVLLFLKMLYDKQCFNVWTASGAVLFVSLFYIGKTVRYGPYFYLFLMILLVSTVLVIWKEPAGQHLTNNQ